MKAKIKKTLEKAQIQTGTIEALIFMSIIATIALFVS